VQIKPTHGVDIETFDFKTEDGEGWAFVVCDLGGQPLYQKVFWEVGVKQATDGIIFMVDATDREHIAETKDVFRYMVNLLQDGTPVLILANKQDLKEKNPMSEKEVLEQYEVANILTSHSVHVAACSGMCGDGLKEAFSYVVEKIKNR
jgi:signal recognition particle receptor subunit beta